MQPWRRKQIRCAARSQSPRFHWECWQNIMKEKFQSMEHCCWCDLLRNFCFALVDQRWSTIDLADIRRARIRYQRRRFGKFETTFSSFLKNLHVDCSLIGLNKRWIYLETNTGWIFTFLFIFYSANEDVDINSIFRLHQLSTQHNCTNKFNVLFNSSPVTNCFSLRIVLRIKMKNLNWTRQRIEESNKKYNNNPVHAKSLCSRCGYKLLTKRIIRSARVFYRFCFLYFAAHVCVCVWRTHASAAMLICVCGSLSATAWRLNFDCVADASVFYRRYGPTFEL